MTYYPKAILFDGTTDFMLRGADLTGNADSKSGILSTWIRLDGKDGQNIRIITRDENPRVRLRRSTSNTFRITLNNAANSDILVVTSSSTYVAGPEWIHVLASWDLATPESSLYINDINDSITSVEIDDTIDYTAVNWAVGATVPGAEKLPGALSDMYFAPGQFLDFTVEANRRKFIDANGNPAPLGFDGSLPTGTAPLVYLRGIETDQGVNSGTGGDFVSQSTQVPGETPGPVGDGTSGAPSTYVPNAILFDGSTNSLQRASALNGVADGKEGIFSTWFRFDGGDGVDQRIFSNAALRVDIRKIGANTLRIDCDNSVGTLILRMNTVTAFTASAAWHHLLISWDLAATVANIFIDDVDDEALGATKIDDVIDYSPFAWAIGASTTPSTFLFGALADPYFIPEFLDITVVSNRRKFIDANGDPVFLGNDGSLPTGGQSAVYMSGSSPDAGINGGYGGDFVETGTFQHGETQGPVELVGQANILSRRSDRYHRLHR